MRKTQIALHLQEDALRAHLREVGDGFRPFFEARPNLKREILETKRQNVNETKRCLAKPLNPDPSLT